jgi:hypothetical protein
MRKSLVRRFKFLGTMSILTARQRVCAGHVRSLRTLVRCHWFGRAIDILVFRRGDESNGT